jgi:hypothetical protein
VKYNALLREFGANLEGCKGNKYVTTTHVINSAIVKLSKLTIATKVYRGVGGGVLPESFWRPNEQGVKGGIEMAFMSATFKRDEAMKYAKSDSGKPALIFEMQMGMVDRGAKLRWVSQYPHEKGERHTVHPCSHLNRLSTPPCVFAAGRVRLRSTHRHRGTWDTCRKRSARDRGAIEYQPERVDDRAG